MTTKRQLKAYESVALRPEDISGKISFFDIFGRKAAVHPAKNTPDSNRRKKRLVSGRVHIEIGSGKGTFLLGQAQAFPEINFLGIEWANKYYKYAVDRIGRRAILNVRLMRTEAASFIANSVEDRSVECFHIYYPDPWPKKRHHKRRFICTENVLQMVRCLKKNGLINIATDHDGYFQWMQDVFKGFTKELKPADFLSPAGAGDGELVGTNYERKYAKEKRKVYTLAFRKR